MFEAKREQRTENCYPWKLFYQDAKVEDSPWLPHLRFSNQIRNTEFLVRFSDETNEGMKNAEGSTSIPFNNSSGDSDRISISNSFLR